MPERPAAWPGFRVGGFITEGVPCSAENFGERVGGLSYSVLPRTGLSRPEGVGLISALPPPFIINLDLASDLFSESRKDTSAWTPL